MPTAQRPEVVVITGGAAGVGRATVQTFAKRGAHIGPIARGGPGMDGLEGAKRDAEAVGGEGPDPAGRSRRHQKDAITQQASA